MPSIIELIMLVNDQFRQFKNRLCLNITLGVYRGFTLDLLLNHASLHEVFSIVIQPINHIN